MHKLHRPVLQARAPRLLELAQLDMPPREQNDIEAFAILTECLFGVNAVLAFVYTGYVAWECGENDEVGQVMKVWQVVYCIGA